MTRSEPETSGTTPRTRPRRGLSSRPAAVGLTRMAARFLFLLLLQLLLNAAAERPALADPVPQGTITEVRVIGQVSIVETEIRRHIASRAGRELDATTIDADYRALMGTKWFSNVEILYEKDPAQEDGFILTYRVYEAPVLKTVEFRGRSKIREKDLIEATSLKPGARADHIRNQLAVSQIKRLYEEKGYELAEISLLEGGKPGDTSAIFQIFEGPKCRVTEIAFTGNQIITDATLRTKISTKTPLLLLRGRYHRDQVDEDARALREYYQSMGFFEVKVSPIMRRGESAGDIELEFVVWEGTQYKVRNLEFKGNTLLNEAQLREGLVMHGGQPFSDVLRDADRKNLETKYGEIGCIDAAIEIERRYADPQKQPGVVDLVYRIEEGDPYLLGNFIIRGNERTRDRVLRREAEMAGLVPGEPLNMKRVELYKERLKNLRYFVADPSMGQPIDLQIVNRRPHDRPYGEVPLASLDEVIRTRFQNPGPDSPPPAMEGFSDDPPVMAQAAPSPAQGAGGGAGAAADPLGGAFGASDLFAPKADDPLPPIGVNAQPAPLLGGPPPLGGPPGAPGTGALPVGSGEPPGMFPSLPGGNMTDVGPDRQEPFPNRSYADIVTQVEEAPTGKLMFGVGATSYGGLSGNFILHESNFDILNIPRSWRDVTNGTAFRGGGQDFRVELSPGTLINRMLVSWRNPYLFNLPGGYALGFGSSGYLFSRVYQGQFNETRGGGRFSIGSQLGTSTYADLAARVEDVNISGFFYPAPADYLAVAGHTFLTSLRPSLRFDNRNDPYSPNKGQYLELAYEQLWGTFTAPKFTAEGRQYFTLWNRPDGTGKHILTFRGFFGIAGEDTPVYERFFAGDFRSMRGFSYRGVGPFVLDRNVGGIMSAVGSIEYQFPWIASDKLQQVVFTDFGTVEPDYQFTTFRAAVGTGLRIYLPQQMFGPLPLAFDLAFPVVKGPDDRERLFTFFIGAFW